MVNTINPEEWMILLALITTAFLTWMFVKWLEEHYPWLFVMDDVTVDSELMDAEIARFGRFLNQTERKTKAYKEWHREWSKTR